MDASFLVVLIALPLWWLLIRPLRSTALAEHSRAATVVAHAADAIMTINQEGMVESFNPAAERIFGYEEQEVLGRPVTVLMPERYREAHQQGLERMRSGAGPRLIGETVEMHGLRKDGSEFPLELSLTTWQVGHRTFSTAISRDITERKRTEEALREAKETLQALIQASPLAILAIDPAGNVRMWNRAAEQTFGWSEHEVVGRPLPIVPEEKQEEFRALRQRVLQNEAFTGMELRRRRRDGSLIEVSLSTAPLHDAKGDITGIMAILEDITQRKRAEDKLRLQSVALDSAANAILVADREGRITWVNPAFTRLTGYTLDEVLGQTPRVLKSGKQEQVFFQQLWGTILAGQVWQGEIINRRKDGSLFTEEQTITPVWDGRGQISHFIAIHHDVTERKRAEETLHALYRASLHIQEPLGLRDRLSRLLTTAREVLQLDRLNILLADPQGQWLEAVASLGTEEPPETLRVPIGPEGGGIAQAYLTQQTIGWDGHGPVPESYRLKPPYDQIAAFRSHAFANVPLIVHGRTIGVLGVDRKHSRQPLDAATLELLQLFAGQAALAIEQARLYEGVQAEAQREAALRTVAEALTANLGSEAIFQVMVEKAVEVAHAEKGALFAFDPREQELRTVAHAGLSPAIRSLGFKVGESVTGRAVLWGRPIAIPDVETDTEHEVRVDLARREGIRAILTMPLMSKEQVVGALSVYHTQPHAFTDDEITRLRLYGHQAAIAIENAQLYQASREHAARLETRVQERTRELEVANRGLEEASRHKSEFLANMSHEIRTPLNSIIGFAELVGEQRVGPLTEKQARYLGHIQNSGKHLLHLI
ncbi:MAG: PAS domain S-box protein, partial [candidate division NC10 bacterium]|nr:PAS domain S-box protein [candidate division NC10 bacterium]